MNLTAVAHRVDPARRARRYGHAGAVIWLTGLSASGKSTLAMGLEAHLLAAGYACYCLDGDNVRRGLNANLDFSPAGRRENIRRVGEAAALFADAGLIAIAAFISPYRTDREAARAAAMRAGVAFHEIWLAAELAACEARDPKGLYRRARAGELPDFTGIDAPYEPPLTADLILDTGYEPPAQSLQRLLEHVMTQLPLLPDMYIRTTRTRSRDR